MSGCSPPSIREPDSSSIKTEKFWCQTHLGVVNFFFMWTIDNFDMVQMVNESLRSDPFPEEGNGNVKWMLELSPPASQDDTDFMGLYLKLVSSDREQVSAFYAISILDVERKPKCLKKSSNLVKFTRGCKSGFNEFVKMSEVMDPDMKLISDNRLRVSCLIRMVGGWSTTSGKFARYGNARSEFSSVPKDMGRMLESQKFCDVVLVGCDGIELPAHKVLLAGRSAVFASMFDHQMKENIQNRVEIADVSSDVLREVLWYIYTGESPNLPSMVNDLLAAADKYALGGLKELCGEFLSRNITIDSAAEVYVLADRHDTGQLKTFVRDFICDHAVDFVEMPGWENLLVGHPALAKEISKAIATRTCEPALKKLKPLNG